MSGASSSRERQLFNTLHPKLCKCIALGNSSSHLTRSCVRLSLAGFTRCDLGCCLQEFFHAFLLLLQTTQDINLDISKGNKINQLEVMDILSLSYTSALWRWFYHWVSSSPSSNHPRCKPSFLLRSWGLHQVQSDKRTTRHYWHCVRQRGRFYQGYKPYTRTECNMILQEVYTDLPYSIPPGSLTSMWKMWRLNRNQRSLLERT